MSPLGKKNLNCPSCKNPVEAQWKVCPNCGGTLSVLKADLVCPRCKNPVEPQWEICPNCGQNITYPKKEKEIEKRYPQAPQPHAIYPTFQMSIQKKQIIFMGLIAIFILLIGAIVTVLADSSDVFKVGAVIYYLGVMAFGGILFIGALTNDELESNIKMGMMIGASIILAIGFSLVRLF